jgi:hypothetical protein
MRVAETTPKSFNGGSATLIWHGVGSAIPQSQSRKKKKKKKKKRVGFGHWGWLITTPFSLWGWFGHPRPLTKIWVVGHPYFAQRTLQFFYFFKKLMLFLIFFNI